MSVTAVIPARLGSTRLPRKVLADLDGHSVLWHVWRRALAARRVDEVFIVTDADEVVTAATGWGATAFVTPAECPSGTDRVAAALDRLPGDFILNVQGDEPLLDPTVLDALVEGWESSGADVITPVYQLRDAADIENPSVVKVLRAISGRALYFSRSPVPHVRGVPSDDWPAHAPFWGHLGVYGFRREALAAFPALPPGPLEQAEKLEQLRLLENGLTVLTVVVDAVPGSIDTLDDLVRLRKLMAGREAHPTQHPGAQEAHR